MDIVWRWTTPSVLLLFALNIVHILSQNVVPNLPLPNSIQRDCIQGTVNPQQLNLMFPPNQIAQGVAPKSECLRPAAFQEGLCQQNLAYNPFHINCAPFPTCPYPLQGPLFNPLEQPFNPSEARSNYLQSSGPPLLCPQQLSPALPCPGNQVEAYLPHRNLALSHVENFPAPVFQGSIPYPFSPECLPNQASMGPPPCIPPSQCPILFPQIDSLPLSPSPPLVGPHFTPLVPIEKPLFSSPPIETLAPQGITPCAQMNNLPQVPFSMSPPPFTPLVPINNQGISGPFVDIYPPQGCIPGPFFDPSISNGILPPRNLGPLQAPSMSAPQTNCLPIQDIESGNQVSCSPAPPPQLQNCMPTYFRLPKPTLFTPMAQFQGSSSMPPSCESLAGTTFVPQSFYPSSPPVQPMFSYPQMQSITPAPQFPNLPPAGLSNPNVQVIPLVSTPPQSALPPLNLGPCSVANDISSNNFLPTSINLPPSYSCPNGFGPVQPINSILSNKPENIPTACPQICTLPPVVSTSANCNSQIPKSPVENNVPIPITLQINLPAPIVPPPKITIINAAPASSPPLPNKEDFYYDTPYPMPPIILEGRKSRSRSWLPLFLVALFAQNGDYGDGGCGPCNSSPIPIPFPIAIPTNNPVVVNPSCN